MTTLEGSPQDINSRLAAIEATVPRLAAKSDVANMAAKDDIAVLNAKVEAMNAKIVELQVGIEKGQTLLIMWFVGVSLAFTVMLASMLMPLMFAILDRLPKHCGWG